jgi:predicted HTH transcriptional regulator
MADTELSRDDILAGLNAQLRDVEKKIAAVNLDGLMEEKRTLETTIKAFKGELNLTATRRSGGGSKRSTSESVKKRRDEAAKLMLEDPTLTAADIADALSISTATANNDLAALRKDGIIPPGQRGRRSE